VQPHRQHQHKEQRHGEGREGGRTRGRHRLRTSKPASVTSTIGVS
jgi:hypothetical protein